MKKNTGEILKELELCEDFQTFYEENKENMITDNLSNLLEVLLVKKGINKATAIKNSELTEVYGYQIFSGKRHPERRKLLALAVGMGLDLEETQELLKCAGYAMLYAKLPADSTIIHGISHGLSVPQINETLFKNQLETLG